MGGNFLASYNGPRDQQGQRSIVTVIGMHRSGTSALAKGLECLGLNMGDRLIAPGEDNPKGYWEDAEVLAINKALLERNGIAWNDLRIMPESLFLEDSLNDLKDQAVKLLLSRVNQYTYWGFKDPRTLRTLPFWLDVAAQADIVLKFVVALRHPYAVAKSLQARNGISLTRGQLLWGAYTLPFLSLIKKQPHVFVSYDHLLEAPSLIMKKIAQSFALNINRELLRSYAESFLNQSLRHHEFSAKNKTCPDVMLPLMDEIYHLLIMMSSEDDLNQWTDFSVYYEEYQRNQLILELLDAESDYHWKRRGSFLKRLVYG